MRIFCTFGKVTRTGVAQLKRQHFCFVCMHTFTFKEKGKEKPVSFLIPILFRLCAKLGHRATYDRFHPLFDDFILREFSPISDLALAELILIHGVLDHGTTIDRDFPDDFAEYCKQVSQIEPKR